MVRPTNKATEEIEEWIKTIIIPREKERIQKIQEYDSRLFEFPEYKDSTQVEEINCYIETRKKCYFR